MVIGTSVSGMAESGVLVPGGGNVRLLRPDGSTNDRGLRRKRGYTTWEMDHHLVCILDRGEFVPAEKIAKLGADAETARELAYRLCNQKERLPEAQSCNALAHSRLEVVRLARQAADSLQGSLFDGSGDLNGSDLH